MAMVQPTSVCPSGCALSFGMTAGVEPGFAQLANCDYLLKQDIDNGTETIDLSHWSIRFGSEKINMTVSRILKTALPLALVFCLPANAKPLHRAEVQRLVKVLGLGNADHRHSIAMDFAPVQNMSLLAGVHCALYVVSRDAILQQLPTRYSGSYCRIQTIGFYDLDNDGDKDMLVISQSRTGAAGEYLYFEVADGYRNTGDPKAPFEHRDKWADGSDASKGIQKVLRWAKKNPLN